MIEQSFINSEKESEEGNEKPCIEHPNGIIDYILSNKYIITSCLDKKIRIFDRKDNTLLKTLKGHLSTINAIIYLNTDILVSGGDESKLYLWDFSVKKLKIKNF